MSKQMDEFKRLQAEKKTITEQQKEIKKGLDATKGERRIVRERKAAIRKEIQGCKRTLRENCAKVYSVLSKGISEEIAGLSKNILTDSNILSDLISEFAIIENSTDEL